MNAATPALVDFSYAYPADPKLRRLAIRCIDRLTGQPPLKQLHQCYSCRPVPGEDPSAAVRFLDLRLDVDPARLEAIHRSGPASSSAASHRTLPWCGCKSLACHLQQLTNAPAARDG